MIDELTNVSDKVSIDILAEALSVVVMNDCFAERVTVGLTGGMRIYVSACGDGMPTEVFVTAEIVAMIASEVAAPVSHGRDGRAGVMIDVLTDTVINAVSCNRTNVLGGVDANM